MVHSANWRMFSGFSGLYLTAPSLGTVTIKTFSVHIQILTGKSTSYQWITSQRDGGKETKLAAWTNSNTPFIKFSISGKHHLLRCHKRENLDITLLKNVDYFQGRGAIPSLDIALHKVRRPSPPISTWFITVRWLVNWKELLVSSQSLSQLITCSVSLCRGLREQKLTQGNIIAI